jgi:prepilin-type N-terminal cleavage/methylation domain-containing protein
VRRPTGGAFTLIELLVALAILAVLSVGVTVPLFLSNSEDHKLRDAARHLTDMMQFCNSMAVFESAGYRLYFDPAAGQCAVSIERFPQEEPGVYTLYEASGFSLYTLPDGVTFADFIIEADGANETESEDESSVETQDSNEEDPYIEFRRDGTADSASFVLNCGSRYLGVSISGLTSAVRLIENPAVSTPSDQDLPADASAPQIVPGLDPNSPPDSSGAENNPDFQSNSALQERTPGDTKASTLRDRLTRNSASGTGGKSPDNSSSRPTRGTTQSGGPTR